MRVRSDLAPWRGCRGRLFETLQICNNHGCWTRCRPAHVVAPEVNDYRCCFATHHCQWQNARQERCGTRRTRKLYEAHQAVAYDWRQSRETPCMMRAPAKVVCKRSAIWRLAASEIETLSHWSAPTVSVAWRTRRDGRPRENSY